MTERSVVPPAVAVWGLMALLAASLFARQVWLHWPAPDAGLFERVLFSHSVLPRGAVALLAGAALGLAGALLQRTLRNPIADPSTLGVAAGAQLAMTAATLYAPVLMEFAREPVAFLGGSLSLAVILGLSWRRGLDPVTVVLCGMLISLTAASFSAAMILANGEYMMSLFIWGGGALGQQSWEPSLALAWRFFLVGGIVALLYRPLVLLGLDDTNARSLGLSVAGTRLAVLAVAVALATSVTALVGVIGFVGLAAPNMARLAGARTLRAVLVASPLIGAVILFLTDGLVQLAAGDEGALVPTGAATALLGGPLLLWLLPKLKTGRPAQVRASTARTTRPRGALLLLGLALLVLLLVALTLGPDGTGWSLALGESFATVAPWRWPRILAGAAAGAMLAAAGMAMQRVTGNPMASPEVLGVSAGAGVGLAAVLLLVPGPTREVQLLGAFLGSLAALVLVLLVAARSHFGPERLLLGGIAVGALSGAAISAVMATGGPQAFQLLAWLSGSTHGVGPADAMTAAFAAVVLIAPLPLFLRWLAILPLGAGISRGLGLSPQLAGAGLVLFSALASAAATLFVGPLSFVGLMAPHLARLAGFARPGPQLAASVLCGMLLMVLADWLSRTLAFPYQLPLGLFASLIGGPYLVWMLNRRQA